MKPFKFSITVMACISIFFSTPFRVVAQSSQQPGYHVLTDEEVNKIFQQRTDTPRYTDFHGHASMKNTNNHGITDAYITAHANDPEFQKLNWYGSKKKTDDKFNNFKSYRQFDFGMIQQSGAAILATSISPIEKHLLSKKIPIWYIPVSFRFINGKLVSHLPPSRLKYLYSKYNSSNAVFQTELRFLLSQQTTSPDIPNYEISLAKNKEDLIDKYIKGQTAMVLTLEGGHILHGDSISLHKSYDEKAFSDNEQKEILDNVDKLKNLSHRVFFITLGHFIWNGLVGSPKTLDMDNSKRKFLQFFSRRRKFRRKLFLKHADGIVGPVYNDLTKRDTRSYEKEYCECLREIDTAAKTGDIGRKVIEKLLDRSGKYNAPIFLDMKHMDFAARDQYYKYLLTRQDNIPIIASHIAVSGKDTATLRYTSLCPVYDVYEEVTNTNKFYERQFTVPDNKSRIACLDSTKVDLNLINWFYPWGINLAIEEIPIIYKSDGIIGVALEERVLGTNRPNYREKSFLKRFDSLAKAEGLNKADRETFFAMLPFFKNIFFIAENCGYKNSRAWDHIALGSDFDGIAKPVSFCKSAAEIPKMYHLMIRFIPAFLKLENKSTDILYGYSPEQIAKKVVYENGEKFILKYF